MSKSSMLGHMGSALQSTLFWGALSTVIAIVLTVVGVVMHDIRWLLLGAWPFATIAGWEFWRISFSGSSRAVWPATFITSIVAAAVLWLLYIGLEPSQELSAQSDPSPCFDRTNPSTEMKARAEQLQPSVLPSRLGEPEGCLRLLPDASRQSFEHTSVLWIPSPRRFIFLNHRTLQWTRYDELDYCRGQWCTDDTAGKQHFKTVGGTVPPGEHAPFAGTAKYLDEFPEKWKEFGWMNWHCQIRPNSVMYREFQHGFVIGVVPSAPDNVSGQVFIMYDDKYFETRTVPVQGPTCSGVI